MLIKKLKCVVTLRVVVLPLCKKNYVRKTKYLYFQIARNYRKDSNM